MSVVVVVINKPQRRQMSNAQLGRQRDSAPPSE